MSWRNHWQCNNVFHFISFLTFQTIAIDDCCKINESSRITDTRSNEFYRASSSPASPQRFLSCSSLSLSLCSVCMSFSLYLGRLTSLRSDQHIVADATRVSRYIRQRAAEHTESFRYYQCFAAEISPRCSVTFRWISLGHACARRCCCCCCCYFVETWLDARSLTDKRRTVYATTCLLLCLFPEKIIEYCSRARWDYT